jgi:hypothetical protein
MTFFIKMCQSQNEKGKPAFDRKDKFPGEVTVKSGVIFTRYTLSDIIITDLNFKLRTFS